MSGRRWRDPEGGLKDPENLGSTVARLPFFFLSLLIRRAEKWELLAASSTPTRGGFGQSSGTVVMKSAHHKKCEGPFAQKKNAPQTPANTCDVGPLGAHGDPVRDR